MLSKASRTDLNRRMECLVERKRAFRQPLFERLAFQVLHHQELDPVLVAYIEHRADVWVTQCGEGFGLPLEPMFQIRIRVDVLWQDLDGHRAVKSRIGGLVDLTHAARANRRLDYVRTKSGAEL